MHTIWWWCTHPKPDEHTQSKSRNHSLENNPLEQVHTSTNTNRQKYQLDKPLTDWDDQWLRVQKQTLRKSIPYYTQNNVKTRIQTDSALTRIWTLNVPILIAVSLCPLSISFHIQWRPTCLFLPPILRSDQKWPPASTTNRVLGIINITKEEARTQYHNITIDNRRRRRFNWLTLN